MQNKKANVWGLYVLLAVVLVMLVCAVARRNPYGFYTILRWVCCVGFVYSALVSRLLGKTAWTAIFAIEAVLLNPFVEFHFRRDTWQTFDKLAIASVVVAAVMFWKELKISEVYEPVDLDALVREGKKLYLSNGEGMTAENIKAFNLFYRAAEAGHLGARYLVYRCYRFGHGVDGNRATYLERLRRSDEAGFPRTLKQLGVRHLSDKEGYPKDQEEALMLFRQAAAVAMDSDFAARACYLISVFDPDRAEAFEWSKKAAKLGHCDALGNVIHAYKDGEAFPENYVVYDYNDKTPIPQSHVEAYKWLLLGGMDVAALTALMPSSELETAQRLYHEFKAKCLPIIPGT